MDNQEREFVTVKDINGCFLKTYKSSHHAKCVVKHGTYEPALYYFLKDYLSKIDDPVCLDVGAHVGIHTVTMSKLSKQVLAFEPAKATFNLLKKNIERNCLENVRIFNEGLSNIVNERELYHCCPVNPGRNSLDNDGKISPSELVQLSKGDESLEREGISKVDVIKIDVEGHEGEVIEGLAQTIKRNRPLLAIEWNRDSTRKYFVEKKLFDEVMTGYSCLSLETLIESTKRSLYQHIKQKKLAKLINSVTKRFLPSSKYIVSDFHFNKDYSLVLMLPNK